MKKSILLWQFAGATFTAVLGTILHFLFEWTNNHFVASFSAVNESTWEHMKILFFPMLIFAVIQWLFFGREYDGFWWIKLFGITIGVATIPILFYTYNGAIGKTPDWLNILIFFIAAGLGFFVEYLLFQRDFYLPSPWIPILLLAVGVFAFVVFTYIPPQLLIFQDPVSKTFGVKRAKLY
jgi:hypothetical protein